MRLIDADKLIDDLSDLKKSPWANEPWLSDQRKLGMREAIDMIQSIVRVDSQTVDAVPVRHGKWVRNEFGARCGVCGLYAYRDKFGQPWESPYCPNCGAKMGERKE